MGFKIQLPRNMLRAVSRFAARKDIRHYLNGVNVEVHANVAYIVATDGHAMGIGRVAREDHALMEGQGSAVIPVEFLAKIKAAGRNGYIPLILTVSDAVDGVSDFTLQDVAESSTVSGKTIEGGYPDWRRVVPSKLSGAAEQFNPEYLATCAKASADLGSGMGIISIGYNGDPNGKGHDSAAVVTFASSPDVFAIVMPWREDQPAGAPEWAREDSAAAGRLDVDAALAAAFPVAVVSPDVAAWVDPDGALQSAGLMAIAA